MTVPPSPRVGGRELHERVIEDDQNVRLVDLRLAADRLVRQTEEAEHRRAFALHAEKRDELAVRAGADGGFDHDVRRFDNALPAAAVQTDFFHCIRLHIHFIRFCSWVLFFKTSVLL